MYEDGWEYKLERKEFLKHAESEQSIGSSASLLFWTRTIRMYRLAPTFSARAGSRLVSSFTQLLTTASLETSFLAQYTPPESSTFHIQ